MQFKETTLLTNQTLYDVAIQEYGNTNGIFLLLEDNPELVTNFAEIPEAGTKLMIRTSIPEWNDTNLTFVKEFARREQMVVSGIPDGVVALQNPIYIWEHYWPRDYIKWQKIPANGFGKIKYFTA